MPATEVARQTPVQKAANGIQYALYGDAKMSAADVAHVVEAVPGAIAAALSRKAYYFVPLAMSEGRSSDATLIATEYTSEFVDQATCHRNVVLDDAEGVFISARLLSDRFALAFEFFINAGHAFVDVAGVPESFDHLVWAQAVADIRGETSIDAWDGRMAALVPEGRTNSKPVVDEKAKLSYLEAAFADAVAIYLLSMAVDFDYSELREREYPLLAPQALAERLRLVAELFPPNPNYEFAIRYRRRA
ncbi:MAG: hypothetical protein FWD64_05740 [Acidobacteriaceae bacterium]|nr:hypothetical protein [Acidobacteriaceae bacterium]